nr:hypothetical protein [Tanacetum cinerariifolium]
VLVPRRHDSYVDGASIKHAAEFCVHGLPTKRKEKHKRGECWDQGAGASNASCDGSPKASNSSPLVSPTANINMPRGLYNVDVAATFGVSLTNVGDFDVLIKDIEADDSTIVDALVAENLNVDESRIVLLWKRLVPDLLILCMVISFVSIPITVVTPVVPTPIVEMTNDGFQTVGKKKKKSKSKSINRGQIGGHSVKQNVRNQPPKATITSTKEGNNTMSNSYVALEDESDEYIENVYDESANLFHSKTSESSSTFATAAG